MRFCKYDRLGYEGKNIFKNFGKNINNKKKTKRLNIVVGTSKTFPSLCS